MRPFIIPFVLIGVFSLGGPSLARETTLRKSTIEEVKSICAKVGGNLSQDAQGFGCGTDCRGQPGTDCTLYCKIGQKCVAQTIGARRAKNFEDALKIPERHPH